MFGLLRFLCYFPKTQVLFTIYAADKPSFEFLCTTESNKSYFNCSDAKKIS